uniref:Neurotrophin 1, isoform F n=2 Tax=Drosophila melanogaster TaxID=7227 RepID=Q9VZA9_DROME|nr:neurotrophin 1, isoform G [Drosophila melanogaster]NP_001261418.1 neurotrophin 1, isoform H [Drosophila melanogaster]NP_729009.2 neurotrophin 1, isoform F [Drosophila melanogaster]AAF47915.3 neurotrophin 1, isoform F [Drosophila melanogaster]AGB94112.1 neurotrophin 1, isoform G [Drosophila melanogaster]AGB94113.1 neurotrophin 1, isoform H [Drosophila melanogaster]|eukprot:NP_001261417.1 neurotrophin 1, isoform G [Drosophila melanogaster]
MKAGRAFGCLFWALLYCVLYLDLVSGNSADDELMDFDFADSNDAAMEDWQLDDLEEAKKAEQAEKKLESNMLDFSVDLDEPEPEKQLPPFDWRERVLRNALAKALADEGLRQKFAEVLPILRMLSSQQRLALSALISAQMNAKKGHELKFEQVRMMFGNEKKLLLPIVFDIANLIKSSTRKYINLGSDLASSALYHTPINRREDDLTPEESQQDDQLGTIAVEVEPKKVSTEEVQLESLEDFFDEMGSEVLDPQMINEALTGDLHDNKTKTFKPENHGQRVRRSANEFVHKLTRSVPASVTEQQLLGGIAGRTIKLNTTAFQQPSSQEEEKMASSNGGQSYSEVEDLAFAGLNGTEIPLSADERLDLQRNSAEETEEPLPSPEELIAGPRYRLGKRPLPGQKSGSPIKRKRVTSSLRGRPKTAASSHKPVVTPPNKKCERFTSNMCIRTDDYPLEQIMGSIRRHKNAMSALLAEFYDKPNNNLEFSDDFDDFSLSKKRREDEGSAGGMCQSVVRYARPQKAKSASGEWKYIVNTGQHTQTLRLEKCSNPVESCSYLAQTYRSHCSQVYNYHRLLSWDKVRGLHVDIFKVPTCCSCQVDGYRQQFPPLSSIQAKDYSPQSPVINHSHNGYSTINEEDLDYAEESEEDELGLRYPSFNNRETNELYSSSNKVRVKLPGISSSVGPYLSPPDDDEDRYGGYKSSSSSSKKYYSQVSRRRPQHSEARLDLDLAPSETHSDQEVNLFAGPPNGGAEKPRIPLNRKRIYASTHTAPTTATSSASSSSVPSPAGGAAVRLRFPQTTSLPARTGTAALSPGSGFVSGFSASAGLSSASSAHAAHAHQAGAIAPPGAPPTASPPSSPVNRQGGSKSRPRFYAPPATTTTNTAVVTGSASSLSTERTTQWERDQSTSLPQPPAVYPVSSIFPSGGGSEMSGKRINYNYHPIIDFFEKNRKAEAAATVSSIAEESRIVEQRIFPQNSPKSQQNGMGLGMETITGVYQHPIPVPKTHERRMGYRAHNGGVGGAGAVGGGAGFASDNAWLPMVVE